MFRHASIIFGHHPIFPWRGRSGQKIFFEHEIFDGFQYWFDILGNRFGCVVAAPLSCTWHKKSIVVRQCQWKFWKSGDTQMQECFLSLSYLYNLALNHNWFMAGKLWWPKRNHTKRLLAKTNYSPQSKVSISLRLVQNACRNWVIALRVTPWGPKYAQEP